MTISNVTTPVSKSVKDFDLTSPTLSDLEPPSNAELMARVDELFSRVKSLEGRCETLEHQVDELEAAKSVVEERCEERCEDLETALTKLKAVVEDPDALVEAQETRALMDSDE